MSESNTQTIEETEMSETSEKQEMTAESIKAAVANGAVINMTQLAIALGVLKKGQSVSGSFGKKVKALVPEIADLFKVNAAAGKVVEPKDPPKPKDPKEPKVKPVKPVKAVKAVKTVKPGKFPRHAKNPFREGSSYGIAVDILTAHPKGIRKDEFQKLYMAETGKDAKHSSYDLAVIYSAKKDSRHKSCKDGFVVERENDSVRLIFE
jgi:hypothetical protein